MPRHRKVDKARILDRLEVLRRNTANEQTAVRIMDTQLKVLDNISGDINYSRPIFIVTGARRHDKNDKRIDSAAAAYTKEETASTEQGS